jgi:prepilin-type N-terminal cleavage/methylation domain-containing protein
MTRVSCGTEKNLNRSNLVSRYRGPAGPDEICLVQTQRRGYSLFEILVAMALVALLAGIAMSNLRGGAVRAQSRGAAEVLAEALRSTRQRAQSSGVCSAIALPRQPGSSPLSQGFYRLEGETQPKIARVTNLAGDFSTAFFAAATYAGPSWTSNLPYELKQNGFSFAQWQPPYPSDSLVVFMPSGQAVANFPNKNGQYTILVGTAVDCSGSPTQLNRIRDPYSVIINWSGEVQLEPGLAGGDSSLVGQMSDPGPNQVAPLPSLNSQTNHNPEFVDSYLEIEPKQQPLSRSLIAPAVASATVALDGSLTLTTFARDPDGDSLFCEWKGEGTAGPGHFSCEHGRQMRWDQQQQRWTARWTWRAPAAAKSSEIYKLTCKVSDTRGGFVDQFPLSVKTPEVYPLPTGRMLYTTRREIWQCNWDGTNPVRIVKAAAIGGLTPDYPKWSPDGTKFAFITLEDGSVYCANRDGSDLHTMRLNSGNQLEGLSWDHTGNRLYIFENNTGANYLMLRNLPADARNVVTIPPGPSRSGTSGGYQILSSDSKTRVFLTAKPSEATAFWRNGNISVLSENWGQPSFTPDGKDLIYIRNNRLVRRSVNPNPATQDLGLGPEDVGPPLPMNVKCPVQSPDKDGLWVSGQSVSGGTIKLVLMKRDGTSARTIPVPNPRVDNLDWTWR